MADYFISDLHLSDQTPELLQALDRFVEDKKHDISRLFILGDLFEFWIGDDYQTDCSRQCAKILARLPDVRFMSGNRDFLLSQDYARQAGDIKLLSEPLIMNICGWNAIVVHGDHLCIDDIEYQRMRVILRDQKWQQQFLSQPIDARRVQAYEARKTSQQRSQQITEEIMDVNDGAVSAFMRKHEAKILLHGHTHKPAAHDLEDGCKRLVLGDWGSCGWFFRVDKNDASLVRFSIDDNKAKEHVLATISKH